MLQTSHSGRLLPPWEGLEEKMELPGYGESESQLSQWKGSPQTEAVAQGEPATTSQGG